MINQSVDLLNDTAQLLLLGRQLVVYAVENKHKCIEFLVLGSLVSIFSTIKQPELVLKFFLCIWLRFSQSIDR